MSLSIAPPPAPEPEVVATPRRSLRSYLPAASWLTLALAYFGYFGLLGSSQPFLAAALGEHGLGADRLGLTLAVLSLVGGGMPLLVAAGMARLGLGRTKAFRLFAAATVAIAICLFLQAPTASAASYVAQLILLTAAYAPLNAILDTAALDLCSRRGWAYGRLRMMGSVGFIVTATSMGHIVPATQLTATVHAAVAVLAAVLGLSALFMPQAPRKKVGPTGLRQELSAPVLSPWAIGLLLAALCLHSASFGPYQYGFSLLGRSLHLSSLSISLGWSLGVVSEIAFFGLSGAVLRRFGWRRTLAASFVAAPARWLSLGLFPMPATFFVAQLLHGPSFALFYAAAMSALGNASTARRAARTQTWFCAMVAGLAPGPVMYLAGLSHARAPLPYVFVGISLLNLVAAVLLGAATRLPLQASMRAQPRARRSRMASRRLACAASRYAVTGRS